MSAIFKESHDEYAWCMFGAAALTRPSPLTLQSHEVAAGVADRMLKEFQTRREASRVAGRKEADKP